MRTECMSVCLKDMLPKEIPDYASAKGSHKTALTLAWLEKFLTDGLDKGIIKPGALFPSKAEIAEHLGVGAGTVQIAVRVLEDKGYVKCKQRVGTVVCGVEDSSSGVFKQTTKRDVLIGNLFDMMLTLGVGAKLPKIIEISKLFDVSTGTVKQALNFMCIRGFLTAKGSGTDLIIKKLPKEEDRPAKTETTVILVQKVADIFREHIKNDLKPGDRMPGTQHYAKKLNVSIKTVYDAMKMLNEEGLIKTYKGKYGSIVLSENGENGDDGEFYRWQKLYAGILEKIKKDYSPGMSLPSIKKTAKMYNAGTKTVRRVYDKLIENGYAIHGGFRQPPVVSEVEDHEGMFKWIAVNPGAVSLVKN